MAVHFHLSASSSSSSYPPLRVFHLNFSPYPHSATPMKSSSSSSLRLSSELSPSLQDPVVHETESEPKQSEMFKPDGNSDLKTESKRRQPRSKSSVWVNPKSPRASELRLKSYDVRYPALVGMAETLDSSNPALEDVSLVLVGLGGDLVEQDAVTVLNNMSNPQTALVVLEYFLSKLKSTRQVVLFNVTLKVLRKCRDLESAEKLFDKMLDRGVRPDNVTFSTLITCSRLCSMYDKAVNWFEKMTEYGCKPDVMTYSAMIDVYGRDGDVQKALSLYDRARTEKWRLDVVTFSTLIRIYGKSGNFDGCLNVYEEMKAIGVKPNSVIYNSLLDSMGRAKRPWQAKNIYKEMIDNGISPTWGTYAALLRAFCRVRYGEDALKFYKEMKEKGFELNVVLYNAVLATCADAGYNDEAAEIFQEMKDSETCKPDSWTFSSMVTVYSCSGQVDEAEAMLNEMIQAGFQPNIFILTSLIQCYGKANRTDAVVRTFDQIFELGITPDDRFCGSLLNVMTQTPIEELSKLIDCVERASEKLGYLVKLLVEEESDIGVFREAAMQLFETIEPVVKKAYCNCLIDLCINLNFLEKACELLDMGLKLGIYNNIQSKTPTQWSLQLKTLSYGAALTALHIWMNDLARALENGEELPPALGINTGHGKHKHSEKGLAGVIESHLKNLDSPFYESADGAGWFLTTKSAAKTWLESRNSEEVMSA
ncbi:hypothetical protein V2J09_012306 [Rumex salicifolius]